MSESKEREAFEAACKSQFPTFIERDAWGAYKSASTRVMWTVWQARAALDRPATHAGKAVAWHVGNADGSINKLGAIYHDRRSAVKHIDSYGGELDARIVPLYTAPAPIDTDATDEHAPRAEDATGAPYDADAWRIGEAA